MKVTLAFDRDSTRRKDSNGFLHVAGCHISKEAVNPYLGKEIPFWEELGLDPEKVYMCYRPAEELEKAAHTFNGLPVLGKHQEDSAENPQKKIRVGNVGTDVKFNAPYLDATLTFTDKDGIDEIESESKKELSSSYRWKPVIEKGSFNGENYDIRMTDIEGNHVALVEKGRAGSDVMVHDEDIKKEEVKEMKKKKTKGSIGEKIGGFVRSLTSLRLASDEAPEEIEKKEIELVKEFVEEFDELHKDEPEVEELEKEVEDEEEVKDEDPEKKEGNSEVSEMFKKMGKDEAKKYMDGCDQAYKELFGGKEEKEEKGAMDAANIKAEILAETRKKVEAADRVRPYVGSINALSYDSAEEIYREALRLKGISTKGYDPSSFKAMFSVAVGKKETLAKDSNVVELAGAFKNLGKIKKRS